MLKPIETVYNGYRFRSRLEARWAVFLDVIGEEYQYEVEGYELDGMRYLPDFFLPNRQTWVEIKPKYPSANEWEKVNRLMKLAHQSQATASTYSNYRVWMIVGDPWATFDDYGVGRQLSYVVYIPRLYHEGGELQLDWSSAVFVQCRGCNYIGLEGREFHFEPYLSSLSEGGGYGICCSDKTGVANAAKLLTAYSKSRQARFA